MKDIEYLKKQIKKYPRVCYCHELMELLEDTNKKLEATNDRAKIKEDIKFLNEMHDITQHLMTKQYDFCRLELLNKMIEDWKDELESSAGL